VSGNHFYLEKLNHKQRHKAFNYIQINWKPQFIKRGWNENIYIKTAEGPPWKLLSFTMLLGWVLRIKIITEALRPLQDPPQCLLPSTTPACGDFTFRWSGGGGVVNTTLWWRHLFCHRFNLEQKLYMTHQ
jgi:hypothetical protein